MQTQAAANEPYEPYKYHPAIRSITSQNVDKKGPWARALHDMIDNARRAVTRWEQAAFDATKAACPDVNYPSLGDGETEGAIRAVATLRRYRRDVKRLEMMLGLEAAGRDMAHLDDEIAKCIDKNGSNMQETIIRRLFKGGPCDIHYDWKRTIERRMDRMRKAGRLDMSYGYGRQQTKWYVVTAEVVTQRKAEKVQAAKDEAARKVRRAREKAVVEFLATKGMKASAEYGRVKMSLKDVEKLLGL